MKTAFLSFLISILVVYLFAPGGVFNRKRPEDVEVIHIQPLGKVRKSHLKTVKSSIESFYGIRCEIRPPMGVNQDLLFDHREIYDAEKMLTEYESRYSLVMVTDKRIARDKEFGKAQDLNGVAQRWGDNAVVSTYFMRMYEGEAKSFRDELASVSLHEVGHTFGLMHCPVDRCVMYTVKEYRQPLDARKLTLCSSCRKKIGMQKAPRVK